MEDISIFEEVSGMGHEQVVYCHEKSTGLKAIIAIHNTVLGPALGGTRMWMYENEAQATNDALRLSRGMTFKNSIAGLNLGGGKAVIIGDARKHKSEGMLRAYGRFLKNLNGKYITAEDVGMNANDMEHIAAETSYVSGMPETRGGLGDPSPFTAYTTYMGMKAAAKKQFGTDSLAGKKVSIQGAGHVGEYIIQHLVKEGCEIYVSDFYEDRVKDVVNKYGIKGVSLDEIYDLDVDIYSPCALGATVNNETLERLKCSIIAGCANNQLANEKIHGDLAMQKGILYAPDFLINSGGVINVYAEVIKTSKEWSWNKCEFVYDQTLKVFEQSAAQNINTQQVAIDIAQQRIDQVAAIKSTY